MEEKRKKREAEQEEKRQLKLKQKVCVGERFHVVYLYALKVALQSI